ncbi:hypothetical protein [Roseiterribacter gracilis]|uniref:Uncharacterized protein n=1 Tax=Roseiterribacter gracilis TaxID=2812848 RepID=A0A8S8XHG2_9PROT|nr:hypothetical protein TMPK1_36390 [Rhodospirillales bacterium TMPK1]
MESTEEFHAIPLAALTLHAPLSGLQWWRTKLAEHGTVRRADVEPLLEIPRLLAQAMLFARETTGWCVRVVGSEVDRQLGRRLAGATVVDALPDMSTPLTVLLEEATATHRPVAAAGVAQRVDAGEALSWQGVLLPLDHAFPRVLAVLGWTVEMLDEPLDAGPSEG